MIAEIELGWNFHIVTVMQVICHQHEPAETSHFRTWVKEVSHKIISPMLLSNR